MINPTDLMLDVIRPVLRRLELVKPGINSQAAVNLLVGTACHESTIGGDTYLLQRGGPARGIYQIERKTEIDIWINYIRHRADVRATVEGFMSQYSVTQAAITGACELDLVANLPYQTAIARLKYWRGSFTWPDDPNDIEALADIWKQCYNTPQGKGRPEQFVDAFPTEILT